MRKTNGRICGNFEDRVNRFMRMCLEWQYDIRRGKPKKANEYQSKYNVGKYKKEYFKDIATAVIDRNYVISKMEKISNDRLEYDLKKKNAILNSF